ncbi:Transglutaminase-like enzyme, putative cysteine protease [Dyella sp. OK004]|nr:Transglutaminase-like enzyme, putative cysteine protease [Dyella sp. OK004]
MITARSKRRTMTGRRLRVTAFALALSLAGQLAAQTVPASLDHTITQIDAGQFKAAEEDISRALEQPGLSPQTRDAWLFQRERMRRILLDFTLDADAVKARVRKQIPDLSDAEFARWNAADLFEHQVIDGKTLYFKRSPGNLFRLSPEAVKRRKDQTPITDGPMETLNAYHRQVREAALAEHRSSVLPHRVRMTQTVTVDADAVPAGEAVRAWIPYPRELPGQQDDIRYIASAPAKHDIAPASAMQRTVYLEQPAKAGQKTVFSVTYELTLSAQYHVIDADKVVAPHISPELAPYLAERAPHVVFTDAMRAFSRKVVGDEKNPYRITQKLFAAVDQIPWAGAREYSTISNISDYTLHAGHGDCGQQTLLLITLLRLNGIPARWQSGMVFAENGYSNIHDWGQVYLAPYGWVPIDVTTGQLHPTQPADAPLQWFYVGGLDAWRIAFNSDYGQSFVPPKQHFRSDNVDSQRGEVEWKGGNLYFNQWDYSFKWDVLPAAQGRSGG